MNTQSKRTELTEKNEQRPAITPPVDIYENSDELLVLADLPGVTKDQLSIHFDKGQLTLEGRRVGAVEGNLLASEFRPLDYKRTFLVPQGIDTDKISAELSNGVLRVHLPKAASLRPRQIDITSG